MFTGLGMGLFTFDWSQIIYIGSPLMVPWWAQVNAIFGFVCFYWIVCPILYYTNVSYFFREDGSPALISIDLDFRHSTRRTCLYLPALR